MTKYRIVSRNKTPWDSYCRADYPYYYAQSKLFNAFWIDCRYNPFFSDVRDTYDTELSVVEEWVNNQLHRKLPLKEEVVRTYD